MRGPGQGETRMGDRGQVKTESIRRWALRSVYLATVAFLAVPAQAQQAPSQRAQQGRPPAASQAAEQVLRPDQPLRVRISNRQQPTTFRIAPEAGSDFTVITRSLGSGVDTVLELLSPTGQMLDQDDDSGAESLASSLEVAGAPAGLRIRARTIGEPGEFEILLARVMPRGPADFPTSLGAARNAPPLAIGTPRRLRMQRGEEAFFALPDDPRGLGAFTRNLVRNSDTILALVDAAGRVLAEDDDSGDEGLASYLAIPQGSGPLFLRASGLSRARAEFDLILEPEEPVAPPSFAITLVDSAARPPLPIGQAQRIELRRGQAAYFELPRGEGDLIALTRNLAANTDTVLRLVDANGREVASDDDGGDEELSSRLELPSRATRMFLQASSIGNRPSAFDLVLERDDPGARPAYPASVEEARGKPPLVLGQAVSLTLRAGQLAVFALPENPAALEALTRNLGHGADSVLELLDANGAVLAEDDDGGTESLSSYLEIPAGNRPLFLRATVLGRGTYELLVQVAPPVVPPTFPISVEQATARPPITIGQPMRVELGRRQTAYFRLPAGTALVASTRNLAENTDTVLALVDAAGNVLAEDDDGGDGPLASRLSVPANRAPRFLRVSTLGDRGGGFELLVARRQPASTSR